MDIVSAISFTVPGKPAPQGSKRHVGRGVLIESSREVGPWRERIALAAHNAMYCAGQPLLGCAVDVRLDFVMPRPKSMPKSRTEPATKRPDIDKLARAALDAITSVVIADDSQVVGLRATKRLALPDEQPGMNVKVCW